MVNWPENAEYFIKNDDEVLTDKENSDIKDKLEDLKNKLNNKKIITSLDDFHISDKSNMKMELEDEDNNWVIDKWDLDKFEIRLEKLETLKTKIEEERKQFVNIKLAFLYKDWSEQVNSNKTPDWFRTYLEWLYWITKWWNWDLDLNNKTITNTNWLSWDAKIFVKDLNKLTNHNFTAINMKVNYKDLLDIAENWKTISSWRDENSDSTLNRATEMMKSMDFSRLFESEWWIIAAWAALAVLWKSSPWLAKWVIWTIAAVFWFNKITKWWFLDFLWTERDSAIDQLQSNDFEKRMDKQLNLTDNELKAFKWIDKWDTKTYLDWINELWTNSKDRFDKLVKIAKWEDWNTGIKWCPEWIDQKYYASTLLKIFVNKWWVDLTDFNEWYFDIEQNISIDSFNSDNFEKWYNKFYKTETVKWKKITSIKFKKMNAVLSEQLQNKPWTYSKIVGLFEWVTDSVYKKLDESWTFKMLNENMQDLENIFWWVVLFEYQWNWKFKIFSSKENWAQELHAEIIDSTVRIISWSIWWSASLISWIFWWWDCLKDWIDKFRAINNIKWIDNIWNITDTTEQERLKTLLPKIWEYIKENGISKDDIKFSINNNKWEFKLGTKTLIINNWKIEFK